MGLVNQALTEDTDIPNPREHMAITRIQELVCFRVQGVGQRVRITQDYYDLL